MRPETLADFLGEWRQCGTQMLFKHCPVCGSDRHKTYVNPETGGWWCHAGEHGGGGRVQVAESVRQANQRLLSRLHPPPRQSEEWPEINLPSWMPLSDRARRYLTKRGISEDDAKWLVLVDGDGEYLGHVVIPHFNLRNEIVYWTARKYVEGLTGPKYTGSSGRKPLYVPDYGLGSGPFKQIVLVEGPFDAIAVWQAGYLAVALGGKALPRYLMPDLVSMVQKDGEVVVMLDRVAMADALKIRRQLEGRVEVVRIVVPTRDDPGDMGPEEVRAAIG